MRFLRFSIRRLLIFTALVAIALYVLFIRPMVIAKAFINEIKTSTDLESVSKEYFDGMRTDGARIDGELAERTWSDILHFRQDFAITMVRAAGPPSNGQLVCTHQYRASFGIKERGRPVFEVQGPDPDKKFIL